MGGGNFRQEKAQEEQKKQNKNTKKSKDGKHKQKSNVNDTELKGLESLKKRIGKGELIVVKTDKTGKLAAMSRESYEEAGMEHTEKDTEVDRETCDKIQRIINGHTSSFIKKISG